MPKRISNFLSMLICAYVLSLMVRNNVHHYEKVVVGIVYGISTFLYLCKLLTEEDEVLS